jgi:hypothetical protein
MLLVSQGKLKLLATMIPIRQVLHHRLPIEGGRQRTKPRVQSRASVHYGTSGYFGKMRLLD